MSTSTAPTTTRSPGRTSSIDPARRNRYRGLAAGMLGALAMIAVFIILRPYTNSVSVLDTIADATLLAMPISVFSFLLQTFGTQAKTLFLVGLIAVLVLIGGGLGQRYANRTAGARRTMWPQIQTYAVGITLALGMFLLIISALQTSDAVRGMQAVWAFVVVGIGAEAWATVTALTMTILRSRDPHPLAASEPQAADGTTMDRRRAITTAGAAAVAIGAVGVVGWEVQRVASRPTVGTASAGQIPPAITPIGEFYTISKNFVDPTPDRGDNWELRVEGLVENPGTISRAELEEMAGPDFVSTLTCISNEIGGELIGTARWTGAPLSQVLDRFGVRPNAYDVVAEGEDGYTDSFPVERALSPEPHVVWAMNGEPLPRRHGTPVRLIVPGLYGIKNVKWLTRLTLTADDHRGFWQDRGWTESAIIKTQSHFDVPQARDVVPAGMLTIGGVAFAGDRGISQVEVSFNGGDDWREATIAENPSPAGLSWVVWTMDWTPKTGTYELAVRATDGEGNLQAEESAPTLPDGASGYHQFTVGVA